MRTHQPPYSPAFTMMVGFDVFFRRLLQSARLFWVDPLFFLLRRTFG